MSFSAIKKALYPEQYETRCEIPCLIALLVNIDPMLDIPKGKLLARKDVNYSLGDGDILEVEWRITID